MYKSKWSTDFGLYKYEEFKKESAMTKFIVTATIIGIVLFGGFYLTIFLLKQSFEAPLDLISLDNVTSLIKSSVNATISSELDYDNSTPSAEKLMGDPNPHPFHNNFRGPPPASFIPLPNQHYPQLQNYVRPGYPRNIQDIINYIHPEPPKPKRINFANHDPFHSYKPKDPSDINLLATTNVRFAPPIWKDFKTNPLVPAQSMYKPKYEGKKVRQPIQLTLNVFPMPNDGSRSNYFGFAGGPVGKAKFEGGKGMRARKMVIHLNFYSEEEDEEIEKRFLAGNYESLEDILSQQEN